jgi:glycosyltransferase involved in cell wall biosynthesis
VQYIVEAAKLLKDEPDIEFHIIGEGITYSSVRKSAASMGVDRLFFQAAVPYVELPAAIAQASVCLGGPFGATSKARRVIAGKTFQFLAMAKPTIVGDSPANREVFTHGEDVLMCRMADARALADAILTFKQDALLREHVAQRGYEHCQMQFSLDRQMQSLEHIVSGLL